jgi:hypothetical protein
MTTEHKPHIRLDEIREGLAEWADMGAVEQMRDDATRWVYMVESLVEQYEGAKQAAGAEAQLANEYHAEMTVEVTSGATSRRRRPSSTACGVRRQRVRTWDSIERGTEHRYETGCLSTLASTATRSASGT